jgi:3-oxoadipate enol-lactonase
MSELELDGPAGVLRAEVEGDGPPVLLVHAGIADRRMWDPQWPALVERFRAIRLDLRGHGRSDPPKAAHWPHEDLVAVLDAAGVERAALVGCSYGGSLSVDTAIAHPGRVSALVLAACGPSGKPAPDELRALAGAADELGEAGDLQGACEAEVRIWVDGPQRTPEQTPAAVRQAVAEMNLLAWQAVAESVWDERRIDPPAIGRLSEVRAPALVIAGLLDQPHAIDGCRLLADGIAGARLVEYPDAAHMVTMERASDVTPLVVDFISATLG